MITANNEMVSGYIDGLNSSFDLPPKNQTASYKHGWMNGRDDRLGEPRDNIDVIRARANMILKSNEISKQIKGEE
ncbi:MAG: hypothetical protein QG556_368 [Pseudomonadota bacterium]|nr:hypothetical protein [Pseudomonadota bacterium]